MYIFQNTLAANAAENKTIAVFVTVIRSRLTCAALKVVPLLPNIMTCQEKVPLAAQ